VEHVLPRTWTRDWPFAEGDYAAPYSGTPESVSRTHALDTLGNLTLITGGLNISAGNKSFSEKKLKFAEHTGLFLNKWFVARATWDESEITERGEHLATLAASIWPYIDTV